MGFTITQVGTPMEDRQSFFQWKEDSGIRKFLMVRGGSVTITALRRVRLSLIAREQPLALPRSEPFDYFRSHVFVRSLIINN